MTHEELQAIKARAEAATAAHPEEWGANFVGDVHWVETEDDDQVATVSGDTVEDRKALAEFIAHARTDVPALVAEVERCVEVMRAIIAASDGCQGHAECAHSMKPWFDARELLYTFDNEEEALANLRRMSGHERYMK